MKILHFLIMVFVSLSFFSISQSYNDDKTAMSNFIKRMYNNSPFEGVKVIESEEGNYLISVLSLEKAKYTSQSTMMRVAQVKAQSQASTFLNGAITSEDFIIHTTEQKKGNTSETTSIETIQIIKQNSIGFVKSLELLTNFDIEEGKRMLFVYMVEVK